MSVTGWEILIKAACGGVLVMAFAALAEIVTPKRLAGVFSGAPSVALASLAVTWVANGATDVAKAGHGMVIGAVAFVVYCLAAVPLMRKWGTWRGSVTALGVWIVITAAGYLMT